MFWNRIFTNSLVFVVKDETFNFDWISLETSAILSQVIKLQIHAASPDFYSNILAPRRRNCRKEISRNYSLIDRALQLRKTIFYTPRPSTRGGLKNINTPDAEMLSPTQPTLKPTSLRARN